MTNVNISRLQGGNALVIGSSGYVQDPVQTVSSTATTITNYGAAYITGTTTGPSYAMAAPVAGVHKELILNPSSSGATHRAVILSDSTGTSFTSTGANQVTLATSALLNVRLRGVSSTAWRVVGVFTSTMGGFAARST